MPMWLFLLVILGSALAFGAIYDVVNHRNPKVLPKNHNELDKVYAEQHLQGARDTINGHNG